MAVTTIKVSKETLEILKGLRMTPRESYEEIILRMIDEINKQGLIENG